MVRSSAKTTIATAAAAAAVLAMPAALPPAAHASIPVDPRMFEVTTAYAPTEDFEMEMKVEAAKQTLVLYGICTLVAAGTAGVVANSRRLPDPDPKAKPNLRRPSDYMEDFS